MALVLHHSRAKGTAKLVLLGIANHAGDGGAWPSIATLAKYANVHERNVQKAIDQLVQLGELHVHVQAGGTHRTKDHERPNRYDVVVTCPQHCDRSASHRLRDLPRAQAELWTTGVANTPPGGDSAARPVANATPAPVAPAPPEPSIETNLELHSSYVAQPQTARASTPCTICSLPEAECQRRAATSGHGYTPAVAS